MSTVIHLGALNFGGFTILGDDPGDRLGASVSSAGDINNDGFDDFIIGAPQNNDAGIDAGSAYVIFGKAGGFGSIDLTNLQPSNGFIIRGDLAYDNAGRSVSSAGDVNGDGFDDIIVGAPSGDNAFPNAGEAYVIYGKASGFGTVDLTALAAGSGFVIQGPAQERAAGYDVSSAGDINGDGFDDLIVTSREINPSGWYYAYDTTPSAYVIFGKANPAATINLANLAAADGFRVTSTSSYGWSNFSIAAAGDINGDGFGDIVLGDRFGASDAGEAYVIFGKATGFTNIDAATLAPPNGFRIQGDASFDRAGFSVAGAGDVNDDGYDDIIVGAMGADDGGNNAGEAFVIFGKATGFGTIKLTNLAAGAGFKIQGEGLYSSAGYSVSGAGDVNGDGFQDIIIGAPFGDNGGFNAGRAYVIFGKDTGFGTVDLRNLAPSAGYKVQGDTSYDNAGFSVSRAGDVNGDGFDDLLVSAPNSDAGGSGAGEVHVIFGRGLFDVVRYNAGDFNGDGRDDVLLQHGNGTITDWLGQANGGFFSNHAAANHVLAAGWNVVGIADFNGDGRDDFLLRNDSGNVTNWLGQPNGSFTGNQSFGTYALSTAWHIAGMGDFNGDGRDDVLLRHDSGTITQWLGQADGRFLSNHATSTYDLASQWQIEGTGDFNGDGRDDVLLRHDNGTLTNWLGQANGSFLSNHGTANYALPTSWEVLSTGDFNGDGRDDVLLRHHDGAITDWLGQVGGAFFSNHATAAYSLPVGWEVTSTGDFNGDGRDDVLLRHDNGTVTNWLGQANGTFFSNHAAVNYALDVNWRVPFESLWP